MSGAVAGTADARPRASWLRAAVVDRHADRVPGRRRPRHRRGEHARRTPAPGAPGTQSYFDLARKDCVGTARNDHVQGVVHGRRRRAVGRLLADGRCHQRARLSTSSPMVTVSPICRPGT